MKLKPLTFLTALVLLGDPGRGLAGSAGVLDNAGFFSAAAKADAEHNIRELQRGMKKDVLVETFTEIPADVRSRVNLSDKAATNRMFEDWSARRAQQQSVNGVYIMLVKEPAHLQVKVGNDTLRQAFTLADRDALVREMLNRLRVKNYDGALREGVSFVSATMKGHAPSSVRSRAMPASGSAAPYRSGSGTENSGGWLLPLLLVGLVGWVFFAVLRSLFRGGSSIGGAAVPGAAGGAGGGFMRNMLGGMFGAAAGMWLYDSFFGSRGSSAYGSMPTDSFGGADSGFSGFTGQDSDFSSTGGGGDFGGDGDFGGGDSGGDFGGGDSGGGDF